jgi:hypothetical protein
MPSFADLVEVASAHTARKASASLTSLARSHQASKQTLGEMDEH